MTPFCSMKERYLTIIIQKTAKKSIFDCKLLMSTDIKKFGNRIPKLLLKWLWTLDVHRHSLFILWLIYFFNTSYFLKNLFLIDCDILNFLIHLFLHPKIHLLFCLLKLA